MKKFQVRDGEQGEFDVTTVQIEARTKAFIARAITLAALCVLVVGTLYAAVSGDKTELNVATTYTTHVLTFFLGYYFKTR